MQIATQIFTPRELAVLDKLRRGKPNKIIAYELMLSQSTVKAHIRSIMKKRRSTIALRLSVCGFQIYR